MPPVRPKRHTALLMALLALSGALPATAQAPLAAPPFDAQLRALGDPAELRFLRQLDRLPAEAPELASAIGRRLAAANPADPASIPRAVEEIRARLAADAVGRGDGLSPALAARSLGMAGARSASDSQAWQDALRRAAGAEGVQLESSGFARLLPAQMLETISTLRFSTARAQMLVGAGTAVPGAAGAPLGQPVAATAPIAPGAVVISGAGTRAVRGALRCETEFGRLDGTYVATTQRRSEPYDPAEFREVLYLTMRDLVGRGGQVCTGTLVASRWVLTAAHCVMFRMDGENRMIHLATAAITGSRERHLERALAGPQRHEARRDPDAERNGGASFRVVRAIVPGAYDPGTFTWDVALLELDEDAADGVTAQPARLGNATTVLDTTTIAGFGYSTDRPNDTGVLNIGWPLPAQRRQGFLHITYSSVVTQDGASRICPGDSGGPIFAGRHRGCRVEGAAAARLRNEAPRPREILGVNSNIHNVDPKGVIDGVECGTTSWNRMIDVTAAPVRDWICASTANQAGGCASPPMPAGPVTPRLR